MKSHRVITGKRNTYQSGWYWRIKQKKGAKRATIALARKLLVMIYAMLKSGQLYNEECFGERRRMFQKKRESFLIRALTNLGYHIEAPTF